MEKQARDLAARIEAKQPGWRVSVTEETSYLGGGALPGTALPSLAVSVQSDTESAQALSMRFRLSEPAVIPFIREDVVLLNMRTVSPFQSRATGQALRSRSDQSSIPSPRTAPEHRHRSATSPTAPTEGRSPPRVSITSNDVMTEPT